MQARNHESLWKKFVRVVRKGVVYSGTVIAAVASILIEPGKKHYANLNALEDITSCPDPHESRVQISAIIMTTGAALLLLEVGIYPMWRYLAKPKMAGKVSTESETSLTHDEQDDEENLEPEYFLTQESFVEGQLLVDPESKANSDDEEETDEVTRDSSCLRKCVGVSLSPSVRLIGWVNMLTIETLSAGLGLITLFSKLLDTSEDEFLNDDSDVITFFRTMTLILPWFYCVKIYCFNLAGGAFENADKLGKAIQQNNFNLPCDKALKYTMSVSVLSVLIAGPSTYFYCSNVIPKIGFLRVVIKTNQAVSTISLVFGGINMIITGFMLVPPAYNLFREIFQNGFKAIFEVPDYHSKTLQKLTCGLIANPFKLFRAITIPCILIDSSCNLLEKRIATKCMAFDFIPASRLPIQTSALTCQTKLWVDLIGVPAGSSVFILTLSFNLLQLKRMMSELSSNRTPVAGKKIILATPAKESAEILKGPGRYSVFAESKQNNVVTPFLEERPEQHVSDIYPPTSVFYEDASEDDIDDADYVEIDFKNERGIVASDNQSSPALSMQFR